MEMLSRKIEIKLKKVVSLQLIYINPQNFQVPSQWIVFNPKMFRNLEILLFYYFKIFQVP